MIDPSYITLEEALKQYAARYDNVDELMVPQLMEDKRLPGFLLRAVESGLRVDKTSTEAEFGPVSWDW